MGGFAPQIQVPQSQQTGNINGINGIFQGDGQQDDLQKFLTGLTGLAGGKITLPSQQGQPQMGMPNAYENTVQPYNQQQPKPSTGKGSPANNQFLQNVTGKGV
jgi:ABC-type uncharacterized transport system ATPase subunit